MKNGINLIWFTKIKKIIQVKMKNIKKMLTRTTNRPENIYPQIILIKSVQYDNNVANQGQCDWSLPIWRVHVGD